MKQKERSQFTQWHVGLLKVLRKLIREGNVWLLQISKGRLGNSFLGVPVLVMTSTGRKSGLPRLQPLYYLEDGERVLLVASNAGTTTDPAWLHNVRAIPEVSVNIRGQDRAMTAHVATAEEKAELWPKMTRMFAKWQMMEDRSERSFPVVVLDRLNEELSEQS